jgi:hypothetical protein
MELRMAMTWCFAQNMTFIEHKKERKKGGNFKCEQNTEIN